MWCLLTVIVKILLLSGLAMSEIRMDNLKYKGCFDLSYSLGKRYHEPMRDITLEGCIDICSNKSTRYIGIELSENFCYCGDDIVEFSNSRSDSMCNVLCSDVSTRTCGGDWLMSVYDTVDPTSSHIQGLSVNATLSPLHSTSSTIPPRITELTTITTNYPETTQFRDAKYEGCFVTADILANRKRHHKKMRNITLQACIEMSVDLKMTFAGISASDNTCFCGADLPLITPRLRDSLCSDQCPDKPRKPCGGQWVMSVYDISKMLPLGLSVNATLSPLHFTSPTIASRISELTTSTTNNSETSQFGDATHVGCFGTNNIPNRNHHKMNNINLQACIHMCVDLKMTFAGISASYKTCFCGADLPLINPRSTDFLCSDHCPDKPRLPCGGDWLMSVYDISKMLPLGEESDVDILAKDVNILISEEDSVKLYNLTNLNTSQLLIETKKELPYTVDYHFNRNLLFVSTKKAMYKTTLFPKSIPTTPSTQIIKMANCEGFAVDWIHDKIFWVDCSNLYGSVKVSDLEGRNSTTVLMRSTYRIIKKMVIDPYVGMLFWINFDVIESCETNGANLRTNISQPEITVGGVTLDISNQRIFYAGVRNFLSFLYSTNYEGNDLKTVLTAPEMESVYGLGVIRGFVYWIYLNDDSHDMLYKAPLQQNSSSQTQLLKVFDNDSIVWHMVIVDPDLQKAPQSGPCSSGSCLVQIVEQKKETPARVLLIGVAVVVLVLLVIGVLMYITDMKYWHIVRTKLTMLPCTEERGVESDRRTTYNVNEDNVNLI